MCGIAGFCLNPDHTQNAAAAAAAMLLRIEHRGRHATGAAWIDDARQRLNVKKAPIPASQYVRKNTTADRAQTALLHTRWATQGDPANNGNNHPVTRGRTVLTHNGHISNDAELFRRLRIRRHAQVDSEAAAALLAFTQRDHHPTEVLPAIEGTAALAWFNFFDGIHTLHLARVNHSPLHIGQTARGSFLYGSVGEALIAGAAKLGDRLEWNYIMQEGEYMRVQDGRIVETCRFRPQTRTFLPPASRKDVRFEQRLADLPRPA